MRTHGKKYRKAVEGREIAAVVQPKQALEIVKTKAYAKFDETVDVAVRLGVDPRHADQIIVAPSCSRPVREPPFVCSSSRSVTKPRKPKPPAPISSAPSIWPR